MPPASPSSTCSSFPSRGELETELLDHPVITRRCFRARRPPHAAAPDPWVTTADGFRLGCYVRRTDPAAGWVVYFHGNGETAAECHEYRGDRFAAAGVNVCFAEYRGYGWSDGVPALAALLPDGADVVAALGVPAGRVVAFGRSLGRPLARPPVRHRTLPGRRAALARPSQHLEHRPHSAILPGTGRNVDGGNCHLL